MKSTIYEAWWSRLKGNKVTVNHTYSLFSILLSKSFYYKCNKTLKFWKFKKQVQRKNTIFLHKSDNLWKKLISDNFILD